MGATTVVMLVVVLMSSCLADDIATHLHFTSSTELSFTMAGVDIQTANGEVSISLPQAPTWMEVPTTAVGEPLLPAFQNAVALSALMEPNSDMSWQVVSSNATFTEIAVGDVVQARQPAVQLCGNTTVGRVGTTYHDEDVWYPKSYQIAELHHFHNFRDMQGALMTINPVQYNPRRGVIRVLRQCTVTLVPNTLDSLVDTRTVDPDYFKLYQFVYGNAAHYYNLLTPRGTTGSVLVVTEKEYESVADDYSTWVKSSGLTVAQHTWDGQESADDIKRNVVAPLYKKGLSYLLLIGKKLPYFQMTEFVYSYACDQCYGQLSKSTPGNVNMTVDIAVARLSVNTTADAQAQLAKIKAYQQQSTASWNKNVVATATTLFKLYSHEVANVDILDKAGFNTTTVVADKANKTMVIEALNQGAGIFSYMGHGNGHELLNLTFGLNDIKQLNNAKTPFVFFDTACMNAEFQDLHPSFNEALMSHPTGGAVATVGGTTVEYADSWPGQLCASQMLLNKTATRLGPWMTGAFMCLYKTLKPHDKADMYIQDLTERVVFGDPTMRLAFMK